MITKTHVITFACKLSYVHNFTLHQQIHQCDLPFGISMAFVPYHFFYLYHKLISKQIMYQHYGINHHSMIYNLSLYRQLKSASTIICNNTQKNKLSPDYRTTFGLDVLTYNLWTYLATSH